MLAATILHLIPMRVRPNHVTVFRMLATPLVLILLHVQNYAWGIPVFFFVALTDAIDGAMARTRNQITDWGKMYDPVADKLLIGSVIIVFVMRELSVGLGLAVLGIEACFLVSAWWRLKKGAIVQANIWGKIKMNLEVLGVLLLMFSVVTDWGPLLPFSKGTFILAILFALVSLVTYGV